MNSVKRASLLAFLMVTTLVCRPSFGQSAEGPAPRIVGTLVDFSKVDFSAPIEFKSEKREGPGSGGGAGGNSCALMIRQNTAVLMERLANYKVLTDREDDYNRLVSKIKTAKFELGENLFIGSEKKEAINYPTTNKIVVEKSFCDKMDTITDASIGTLFHEYLGLALIDDHKFQISGHFIQYFNNSIRVRDRMESFQLSKGMNGENCPKIEGEYSQVGRSQKLEYKYDRRAEVIPGMNPILSGVGVFFQSGWGGALSNMVWKFNVIKDGSTTKWVRSEKHNTFENNKVGEKIVDTSLIIDGQEHGKKFDPNPTFDGYYEKYRAGCLQNKLFLEYGSAHNTGASQTGRNERISTYVLRIIVTPVGRDQLTITTQSEHFNKEGRLIFKSYEKEELQKL